MSAKKNNPQGLLEQHHTIEDPKPIWAKLRLGSRLSLSICMIAIAMLAACGKKPPTVAPSPSSKPQEIDQSLTFSDVTLEQADANGQLMWKVHAPTARYNDDDKVARVELPKGELYQDGKLVFRIEAKSGEVHQEGQKIFLKGEIIATDIQDGTVLKGGELEWQPRSDLLIVRNNLSATHAQGNVTAQEAHFFSRKRQMDLTGAVVANLKDPHLRLQSEHLIWQLANQLVISDRATQIDHYPCGPDETCDPSDRVSANQSEVNLETKVSTFKENVQIAMTDPPMQVASNLMTWDYSAETVTSPQPVSVRHNGEQVNASGNQGSMDLSAEVVYLTGGVQAAGRNGAAQLAAEKLTWDIPTQQMEAEGNVVYRQQDPPFNVSGARAVGELQDQTIVVSGGRVVTEIIP